MRGEVVKKPDELVKMRGEFSEGELKFSTYLISLLEENKRIYEVDVKNYLKRFDKNFGDFEYLYQIALNLTKKQFKMFDRFNKEFEIYNFLAAVRYKSGILKIEISSMLLDYLLQIKNKYLKYRIKNIMVLTSKYSIRLYEILKNELEMRKRQKRKLEFEVGLDDLRELLSVPISYKYKDIRIHILEKSQKDFEKTDIGFEFEPIKKGRKVVAIKFKLFDKSKKVLQSDNRLHKTENGFKQFRQELLSKGDIFIKLNNQTFEIKNGLLARDGEILDKEEAWKVWKFLFKNKDNITFLNRNEIENEVKNNLKQKILSEFKGKELKGVPVRLKNGEVNYINAELVDILDFKNEKDFVAVLRSGNKKFKMRLSINSLKNYLI